MFRTHTCGELKKKDVSKKVTLCGWVFRRRDHGGLLFIDMRDRYGLTQVVFDPKDKKVFSLAESLRREFVVQIEGKVKQRPKGTENKDLATGEVEVVCNSLKVLNESLTPNIDIEDDLDSSEEVRLKYRYLDLRRSVMQKNIMLRHKILKATRDFFDKQGFIEIDTPILMKSTPEGARDYLVPSRVHNGKFYALPQSPQIYKQLSMIAGFDKYFQLARCFRDEDLRADRQPEFTQLDMEMSFVEQEDIFNMLENWTKDVMKDAMNLKVKTPLPRITYKEAMDRFGCDKPDMRFGLELQDVTSICKKSSFKVFQQPSVKAIVVPKDIGRKEIDELTKFVQQLGAKCLAWVKYKGKAFDGGVAKHLSDTEKKALSKTLQVKESNTIFFVADKEKQVNDVLSKLRGELGKSLNIIKEEFNFLWVIDFPLFTWSEDDNRFEPEHHPFTGVHAEDVKLLNDKKRLGEIRSTSYDLVLNGIELGSGSIRIHDSQLQKKIFSLIGISDTDAKKRFGFFVDALKYGTPPHGGIALGMDRLVMILAKQDSIREVIPFPKNKFAENPMDDSPAEVHDQQLKELGIKLDLKKK